MVVHHRHIQHAALAPAAVGAAEGAASGAAGGRGQNETLAHKVERLSGTILNRSSPKRLHAVIALQAIVVQVGPGEARAALLAAVPGLVFAVTHDADDQIGLVAAQALLHIVQKAGPEAVDGAVPVLSRATDAQSLELRRTASEIMTLLQGENVEQAMVDLLWEITRILNDSHFSDLLHQERFREIAHHASTSQFIKCFDDLKAYAHFCQSLDPAPLERLLPTLILALRTAVPYIFLASTLTPSPEECVIKFGVALAKVAAVAGPDALYLLTQAEKNVQEDSVAQQIRMSRVIVQEPVQDECATSFLRETGAVHMVSNLTVEIPFGHMLAADANGMPHAHTCPNQYICGFPRRLGMRLPEANHTYRPYVSALSAHLPPAARRAPRQLPGGRGVPYVRPRLRSCIAWLRAVCLRLGAEE